MYIPTRSANVMSFVKTFVCKSEITYWKDSQTFPTLFLSISQVPHLRHRIPFQDLQHSIDPFQEVTYTVEEWTSLHDLEVIRLRRMKGLRQLPSRIQSRQCRWLCLTLAHSRPVGIVNADALSITKM